MKKLGSLNIGQRLGAGFGGIILLMMAITVIAAYQLFQSKVSIGSIINERIPTTVLVYTIKGDLSDMIGNMRSILLAGDAQNSQAELELVEQSKGFIDENTAKLEKMMDPTPEARQHLENLKGRQAIFNESRSRFLELVKGNQMEEANARFISEVRTFADDYARQVDNLVAYQASLSNQAGNQVNASIEHALLIMAALAAIASAVGITLAILVTRGIITPLNDAVVVAEMVASGDLRGAIQVNSEDEIGKLMLSLKHMNESLVRIVGEVRARTDTIASESVDIAAGTVRLSSRTEHQAESLSETAASVVELSSTVQKNGQSTEQAHQLVTSSTLAATKGGEVVAGMIKTMALIKASSTRIGDIIGVIDSIAFQTNILALNAAVEAARAGEQGRGFAVVAAEVRNLAQRSAEAAREVKLLVGDSMQKVDAGNLLVGNAGETMDEIVGAVKKVAEIMNEIAAAGREQRVGIDSVARAITDMDDITKQNTALVEEATVATKSLKDQADYLARAVSVFKLADMHETSGIATPPLLEQDVLQERLQRV